MALDEFGDIFGGGDITTPMDIPDTPLPGLGGGGFPFSPNFSNFGPGENPFGSIFGFGGNTGPSGLGGNTGGDSQSFLQLLNAFTGGHPVQAGVGALGVGAGLTGLIQALMGHQPGAQQTHQITGQERDLTGQTLGALQNLRGLANNAQLNQAVSRLAAGQLPISQDLVSQLTNAFGGVAGNLATGAINNARERGFSGGTNLLVGAGSPQYAQSLAQLQSDVSNQLVNLAVGLPQAASNINSQQIQGNAFGISQGNDLLRLLQSQNQINTQNTGGSSLFNALGPFTQTLGATGGLLAGLNAFNRPQQQQTNPVQPQNSLSGGPR